MHEPGPPPGGRAEEALAALPPVRLAVSPQLAAALRAAGQAQLPPAPGPQTGARVGSGYD